MSKKPYAAACDENKHAILEVIQPLLMNSNQVLEIGSGTGQHAVFFATHMPHLTWHTSDVITHHNGIKAWIKEAKRQNIREPIALDVLHDSWPKFTPDAIFSANTTHIMSWKAVEALFIGVGKILNTDGIFLLYGPFNYHGQYTSASNAQFDQMLRHRDPESGIRDMDALKPLAQAAQLVLQEDYAMPANNRILCWKKQ